MKRNRKAAKEKNESKNENIKEMNKIEKKEKRK